MAICPRFSEQKTEEIKSKITIKSKRGSEGERGPPPHGSLERLPYVEGSRDQAKISKLQPGDVARAMSPASRPLDTFNDTGLGSCF
jgi:hypothetical protein